MNKPNRSTPNLSTPDLSTPNAQRLWSALLPWGKVHFRDLITHLASPTEGELLFTRKSAADPDVLGVVFDWTSFRP